MNYAPNQQNSTNRVPQVHPPPVNSAMSSDQRDIMQNQSSFPISNQPITGVHHQMPQPNNNNMGSAIQQISNLQRPGELSYAEMSPVFAKLTEFVQQQMHAVPQSHPQHQNYMQKLPAVASLPGAQNQVKAGPVPPMNFGNATSPLRQLSPAKATHPQLKTTPTTSKPPFPIAGNNVQKPQTQPTVQVAAPAAPSQPSTLNTHQSPVTQKPATTSPQDKNVPSTPPQNAAAVNSSAQVVAKKTSPIASTAQTAQKIQSPVAPVPQSPQKQATTPVQTPPKVAASPSTNSSDAKSTENAKPSISPVKSSPPASAPTVKASETVVVEKQAPKSVEKVAPTTTQTNKSEEKKPPQQATTPTTPKSSENKLTSPLSKSTMRLATVTPPRQKKPPPTRKSATGVEKQTPIRAAVSASVPKLAKVTPKSNSSPSDSSSPKIKRSRVQVQPYQCPTRNLELATKLSTKSANQEKKENEHDKLIVFYKNEFLAVRNEEGSFYICQTIQNVYKPSKSTKIRIQWLNEKDEKKKSKQGGRVFTIDYLDHTDFECVLTTVELNKIDGKSFELPKEECVRIENILKKAMDVEKGKKPPVVTEDNPDGLDLSLYQSEAQLESKSDKKRRSIDTDSSDDEEDSKPLVKKRKFVEEVKKVETPVKKVEEKVKPVEVKKETPAKAKKVEKAKKTPVKPEPIPTTSKAADRVASKTRVAVKAEAEKPGPSKPSPSSPAKSPAKSPIVAKSTRKK